MALNKNFWRNRRVLVTGHSGFKGSWLALWLSRLGANVTGVSQPPAKTQNLFDLIQVQGLCDSHFCDVRDNVTLNKIVQKAEPEIVFHLAAQALVRRSYDDPVDTFSTNLMGTVHMLDSLRRLDSVRVVVMVTTDKVYQNREWYWPYREGDALGGHDPYSASKAASELVIASYRDAFLREKGIAVASARAGNVIGGGDWSTDRLLPDAIKAWESGETLHVRLPNAVRPWQHVLEPLAGYLLLAEKLWAEPQLAGAYNFGPDHKDTISVKFLLNLALESYGDGDVVFSTTDSGPHESGLLALDTSKTRQAIGFNPKWGIDKAVRTTVSWYCSHAQGADARNLCMSDLEEYESD